MATQEEVRASDASAPAAAEEEEEKIKLTVKHGAKSHQLAMGKGSTVKELMTALESLTNVHARGQKLIFKGENRGR